MAFRTECCAHSNLNRCSSSLVSLGWRVGRTKLPLIFLIRHEKGLKARKRSEKRSEWNVFSTSSSGTKVCTGDFAPPEPEVRAEFCETNFGRPNIGPEKFTLEEFTSQNSPSKIKPKSGQKNHIAPLQSHLADSSAASKYFTSASLEHFHRQKVTPNKNLALDRFAAYNFGQTIQNFRVPSFIVKNGPEKWTPKRAKNVFCCCP